MLGMWIVELWRYPVKSLAGERLTEADLQIGGIAGDRIYQVRRSDGRIVDARAHPKMLALHPTLTPNGDLLIDGKSSRMLRQLVLVPILSEGRIRNGLMFCLFLSQPMALSRHLATITAVFAP